MSARERFEVDWRDLCFTYIAGLWIGATVADTVGWFVIAVVMAVVAFYVGLERWGRSDNA